MKLLSETPLSDSEISTKNKILSKVENYSKRDKARKGQVKLINEMVEQGYGVNMWEDFSSLLGLVNLQHVRLGELNPEQSLTCIGVKNNTSFSPCKEVCLWS